MFVFMKIQYVLDTIYLDALKGLTHHTTNCLGIDENSDQKDNGILKNTHTLFAFEEVHMSSPQNECNLVDHLQDLEVDLDTDEIEIFDFSFNFL